LKEVLRRDAILRAQAENPNLGDLAARADLTWKPNRWHLAAADEVARLGTNPWAYRIYNEFGIRSVGTFYLPVRWLDSDTKRDVEARAVAVLDALWAKLGLTKPGNTAATPRRQQQWDRYLAWLWQRRVEHLSFEAMENVESPGRIDEVVAVQTIKRGVKRAIAALR